MYLLMYTKQANQIREGFVNIKYVVTPWQSKSLPYIVLVFKLAPSMRDRTTFCLAFSSANRAIVNAARVVDQHVAKEEFLIIDMCVCMLHTTLVL